MTSNRITLNILPAATTDSTQADMDIEVDTPMVLTDAISTGITALADTISKESEKALTSYKQEVSKRNSTADVVTESPLNNGANQDNHQSNINKDKQDSHQDINQDSHQDNKKKEGVNQDVNQDVNQNGNNNAMAITNKDNQANQQEQQLEEIPQQTNTAMQEITNGMQMVTENNMALPPCINNMQMNQEGTYSQYDQANQDYTQSFSTQPYFGNQFSSENQTMDVYENNQFCNVYVNEGINIIDPTAYSPMVYVVEGNKMIYSNSYPFVYDSTNKIRKNSSLPYAYISRNSFVKPDFNIAQNKLKLYNYWIETTNPKHLESQIVEMFGSENIYVTKSLFFRKKNSYMGEKVILISKLPQKPFKFINRINRTFTSDRRTIKSVLGDYIISPDCLFIVLAERSIDYICNNYYRYHKSERLKIETLTKSFKEKFTCINESEMY